MDRISTAFVKAALVWLGLGVALGVCMAVDPALIIYRPAHVHMNLLGFVTMFIFGIAYHVIPRFTGHLLHSTRLAAANWWCSNVGLALMVAGFGALPHWSSWGRWTLAGGGTLAALGAYAFIYNIWRTVCAPSFAAISRPPSSSSPPVSRSAGG